MPQDERLPWGVTLAEYHRRCVSCGRTFVVVVRCDYPPGPMMCSDCLDKALYPSEEPTSPC